MGAMEAKVTDLAGRRQRFRFSDRFRARDATSRLAIAEALRRPLPTEAV